jgi:hypothetical protein
MSAISSFSFASRPGAANFAQQAQRGLPSQQAQQAQRGAPTQQAQRLGAAYNPGGFGAARSGGAANASSSYCPTCNTAGGRQSSPAGAAYQGGGQGGAICVTCAYGGR